MWSTAPTIAAGDLVIIWLTRDLCQPLLVVPGRELNSKFGVYAHADLIGVPYGSKLRSRNGRGFVHVLRPTPELWTRALPHRTQILYLPDIAFVCAALDIRPGSVVVEAGTGSGSFSHSVARTIGPTGHLWSYEFHAPRALKAKEEFTRHGMDAFVTLAHRNVCKEGFTVVDAADAVFLDLPAPWDAVEHAKKALRKDRTTRICCFSPCMEQVLRTVTALNDAGFTEIAMYEVLVRPHQVDTAPPLPSIHTATERLKTAEQRREAKRLRQIAQTRGKGKRKRAGDGADADDAQGEGIPEKRTKVEGEELGLNDNEAAAMTQTQTQTGNVLLVDATAVEQQDRERGGEREKDKVKEDDDAVEGEQAKVSYSKAFPEVRGHTSYLTFACLLPMDAVVASTLAPANTTNADIVKSQPLTAPAPDTLAPNELPQTTNQ